MEEKEKSLGDRHCGVTGLRSVVGVSREGRVKRRPFRRVDGWSAEALAYVQYTALTFSFLPLQTPNVSKRIHELVKKEYSAYFRYDNVAPCFLLNF